VQIFWNQPLTDEIQGLDILGVRARDQAIEEQLVNGITTVSLRARYFSILPWAIGAFLKAQLDEQDKGKYVEAKFRRFLRRVEFLTLACTAEDERQQPPINGALGRDLFSGNLQELRSTGHALMTEVRSAMFLTYYGPCRAAGLVRDTQGSAPPYTLTDFGKRLLVIREAGIKPQILDYLSGEGALSQGIVEVAKPWFSLHSVSFDAAERQTLLEAFATPRTTENTANHGKFLATISWVQRRLTAKASSAEWLLIENYAEKVRAGASGDVSDEWAEYEWQRRCYFSFEWLLAVLGSELNEVGDMKISNAVEHLTATGQFDHRYFPGLRQAGLNASSSVRELKDALSGGLLLSAPLPTREMAEAERGDAALSAVAFLISLSMRSMSLRRAGIFGGTDSVISRAMTILDNADAMKISAILEALMSQCVIIPHLTTTLRKMGASQQCSLRFFPDGSVLRPTGIQTTPNRSGTRLANVLGIFSDLSVLEQEHGQYIPGTEVFP